MVATIHYLLSTMHRIPLLVALALAPLVATAQAPAYDRAPGDTLRYVEVTDNVLEVDLPAGTSSSAMHHAATIALAFQPDDGAHAWYEALAIEVVQGDRTVPVATEEALDRTFRLRFPASGRVETLSTPSLPVEVIAVTDLRMQFFDFFIPLPEEPLARGVTWMDTAEVERAEDGETYRSRIEATFEVVGDTVVAGQPAWIIATESRHLVGFEAAAEGGATMRVALEGVETGRAVFAAGRLVERRRAAELIGDLAIDQADDEIRLPQRYRYDSVIRLTNDE
jgi:hypothetical protein